MQNYFDTKDKKLCNGCGVCSLKCPKNAITMIEDSEGFLYPKIDLEKCIHCGICRSICPQIKEYKKTYSNTYYAKNKNKNELLNSSSGGVFIVLAKYVIKHQGVVFGVKYDKNLNVIHDYTETVEGLQAFQGSKYVRSDLNCAYEKVKCFLDKGRYVLFTGTPCQCQGLRSFLGQDNPRLITCEIICHANPSPRIFQMYKDNLEQIHHSKIKQIFFRNKQNGWKNQATLIHFESGKKISDTSYYNAFVKELINRPSCHSCVFSSMNRFSDFTIADLWGIENILPQKVDNLGNSLLNVNTKKGEKILKNIAKKIELIKIDGNTAFSYNHHGNIGEHPKRNKLFKNIAEGKVTSSNVIMEMRRLTHTHFIIKVFRKLKKLFAC